MKTSTLLIIGGAVAAYFLFFGSPAAASAIASSPNFTYLLSWASTYDPTTAAKVTAGLRALQAAGDTDGINTLYYVVTNYFNTGKQLTSSDPYYAKFQALDAAYFHEWGN